LKIPVSLVRFRVWALEKQAVREFSEPLTTFMRPLLLLAAVVFVVAACRSAKVGDACTDGACSGGDSALLCVDGKYVSAPCKGPDGCQKSPFRCDYRDNPGASLCSEPLGVGAPMACSGDKKARIRCVKGKVERDECDGPKGCFPKSGTTMGCDKTLRAGASCSLDGDWCSDDGAEWLQCRGGKLVVVARCRGPARCQAFMETIACDTAFAEENDPCLQKAEVCSADKKSVLGCVDGHFRVQSRCPAGKACTSGTAPGCS
jgi:hypothetical protein